jgi:Arc/MetJ family transcription regulator
MHRTNIELDEKLVKQAMKLTSISTKKELINHALAELVSREKRKKLLAYQGKVKWLGDLSQMRRTRA